MPQASTRRPCAARCRPSLLSTRRLEERSGGRRQSGVGAPGEHGSGPAGVHQVPDHVAAEAVLLHPVAKDRLVDAPQLKHGEFVAGQGVGVQGVSVVASEIVDGPVDDHRMVEQQRFGELVA